MYRRIACLYCLSVLQQNWIKDMDTGAVYVLDGGTDGGGGGSSGGAAGAGRVTELLSGKELRWVLPLAAAAARDVNARRQAGWGRTRGGWLLQAKDARHPAACADPACCCRCPLPAARVQPERI
jgi:hypothetical protein